MHIDKFLGRRVEIPENRRYVRKTGLWAKLENETIVFGFSEPALALVGGFNDFNWLVSEGETVAKGQSIGVAITQKLLYLDAPVDGLIHPNAALPDDPQKVLQDPYGNGWLFKIEPSSAERFFLTLADAQDYLESLRGSEGLKNPEGKKGGISPMCKAVYHSIREQKF